MQTTIWALSVAMGWWKSEITSIEQIYTYINLCYPVSGGPSLEKYKALLADIEEGEEDEVDQEMEITWTTGLEDNKEVGLEVWLKNGLLRNFTPNVAI